jgi:hypothetical protein
MFLPGDCESALSRTLVDLRVGDASGASTSDVGWEATILVLFNANLSPRVCDFGILSCRKWKSRENERVGQDVKRVRALAH